MKNPTPKYWEPLNGNVPKAQPDHLSYAEYLTSLDKEAGLLAEIEWRKHHFASMRNWLNDERVKLFRYEDILGNEVKVFEEIMDHYEMNGLTLKRVKHLADKYRFKSGGRKDKHIRNPQPKQWKEHFTPKVEAVFNEQYGDILELYGYQK